MSLPLSFKGQQEGCRLLGAGFAASLDCFGTGLKYFVPSHVLPAWGARAATRGISQLVALLFNQGSCSCFSGHVNAFISESSVLIPACDVHHALNKTLSAVAVAQSWWRERRACPPSAAVKNNAVVISQSRYCSAACACVMRHFRSSLSPSGAAAALCGGVSG